MFTCASSAEADSRYLEIVSHCELMQELLLYACLFMRPWSSSLSCLRGHPTQLELLGGPCPLPILFGMVQLPFCLTVRGLGELYFTFFAGHLKQTNKQTNLLFMSPAHWAAPSFTFSSPRNPRSEEAHAGHLYDYPSLLNHFHLLLLCVFLFYRTQALMYHPESSALQINHTRDWLIVLLWYTHFGLSWGELL